MYVKYFNFNGKPFGINPDPRFFFNSKTHKQALSTLGYGLGQGQGFIIITGDAGSGKTTMMSALQHMLAKTNVVTARITNTQLDSNEMLRYVAAELDLPYEDLGKVSLLKSIESFLQECQSQDKRVVIIVDEAQNLSGSAIDELRMLMNLISENDSLLQFVLFGQTRLNEHLYTDIFEPLRQRIVATYHLESFDQKETKSYIFHRLRTVRWVGDPEITPESFNAVYDYSLGVPAKINMLCEKVLQAACLNGTHLVTANDVQNIVRELRNNFSDEHFEGSLVEGVIDQIIMERINAPVPVLGSDQVVLSETIEPEIIASEIIESEKIEPIQMKMEAPVEEVIETIEIEVSDIKDVESKLEEFEQAELTPIENETVAVETEEIVMEEGLVIEDSIPELAVVEMEITEENLSEEVLELEKSAEEIIEFEMVEESAIEHVDLELINEPADEKSELITLESPESELEKPTLELELSGIELEELPEVEEEITLGGSMFEDDHFVSPETMEPEVQKWLQQQRQKPEGNQPKEIQKEKSDRASSIDDEFAMERTGNEHLNPFKESTLSDSLEDSIEEVF